MRGFFIQKKAHNIGMQLYTILKKKASQVDGGQKK